MSRAEEGPALVSFLARAGVPKPVEVGGRIVLEAESPVIWFTFPGEWHDIGRFHTPSGRLTGYYANVLTPVEMERGADGDRWRTTDLFLDVFVSPAGADPVLLDRDELDEALREGWVDPATSAAAEAEAARLMSRAREGSFPPAVAREWTLERVRRVLERTA